MARTYTFEVTVDDTGVGGWGYDDAKPATAISPDGIYAVDDGVTEQDITIRSLTVYSSGIEAFTNDQAAPYNFPDETHITEVRMEHSGGTLVIDFPNEWAGSKGEGSIYWWIPNASPIWTVADAGLTYTVEVDTNAAPAIPPPADPDYNLGTRIINPKNPGGGVPIPEAEYTTTQAVEVTGQSVKKGGGGGTGKGGGGGPPAEVIIDLPAQAGTFDLTGNIEAYDFGSETWYPILVGANITGGGTKQRLKVSSSIADVVNASANDVLPYMWRINVVHGDATAVTYSVEYKL